VAERACLNEVGPGGDSSLDLDTVLANVTPSRCAWRTRIRGTLYHFDEATVYAIRAQTSVSAMQ